MSLFYWFTLLTTPAIMVFPHLNEKMIALLWINEALWGLDSMRKLLFQNVQGEDAYTSAVKYLKSTAIIDMLALVP